jgi:hypothetical protein
MYISGAGMPRGRADEISRLARAQRQDGDGARWRGGQRVLDGSGDHDEPL